MAEISPHFQWQRFVLTFAQLRDTIINNLYSPLFSHKERDTEGRVEKCCAICNEDGDEDVVIISNDSNGALQHCSYACHADERNSLLDLKEGLTFTSSHNMVQSWKGFNCCAWKGVTYHPITTHVIFVDLSPQSLNASSDPSDWPFMSWRELHEGLFQLLHLEHLDLSESAFFPPLAIPSHFHKLQKLRYLSLYHSNFVHHITREIGNMSSLIYLDLNSNYLSGSILMSLGELSKLTYLDLSVNYLSGTIPISLGKLSKLTNFDLSSNS